MGKPKISTYRQLTEAETALINEVKALEEQCYCLVDKLRLADVNQRNVNIGMTDLESAFMRLTRAIAQPLRAS